ncbi:glutathione S-transferase family protein [Pseudooceanicola batsensis HTCC2597]|uniref:Glutathione S-transferase family protein n=1 Tax=Pseudooceanicola batsensis (strain ATCC BAA-863 / DSM 15984 / KCTC 12145 / HTCC2597) TaxID=252305 RepID=A3U1L2_PSEBH|nr:glutathione S-transferase family protein [Pseudooceanicola batsensis]EAQ01793.1 glutathione S-transferase family protein [Pseudooceanicola batsensis HTCC2597]
MTTILHHVPGARSFRILWLLQEMGITPEIREWTIQDGSMRSPDFLCKSPAGRIPALEIDGEVIHESGAITEYLCETRPEHGLGRPTGDPERIPFLEMMHYAETSGHLIANLNLQWVFLRDPADRSDTVVKIEARRLAATLAPIEDLLSRQEHMLAGGFSAADTMMGFSLTASQRYVRFDRFPNILAYLDRMAARPAHKAATELDGERNFPVKDFYEVAS